MSRAIYASPVPVISAIGHETDTTLADLVADVRAPTPSAAAELAAPDRAEVVQRLGMLARRADTALTRRLTAARDRAAGRTMALDTALPDLAAALRRIEERTGAARRALEVSLARTGERTAAVTGRLATLSPLATLDRGYAVVTREDGSVVSSAATLQPGDAVQLRLRDGSRAARVTG